MRAATRSPIIGLPAPPGPVALSGPVALPGLLALAGVLALAACGGQHRLAEYQFADRTLATVFTSPPHPELRTGVYSGGRADPVGTVLDAGARVAAEVEGRRARARLESAAEAVDLPARMSARTLERTSRYLGARPVDSPGEADFLLEVHVARFAIEARERAPAALILSAEAVLLDAHRGDEIWSRRVNARETLTPGMHGRADLPQDVVNAAVLYTLTVEDFERILERLADYTADVVTGELRRALREVRR